jgi:hypothetical protein
MDGNSRLYQRVLWQAGILTRRKRPSLLDCRLHESRLTKGVRSGRVVVARSVLSLSSLCLRSYRGLNEAVQRCLAIPKPELDCIAGHSTAASVGSEWALRGGNMWHTGGGILMNLLSKALNSVLRLLGRKLPPEDDPYSYVMAPKKPRPPYRSAAAVAEPPE